MLLIGLPALALVVGLVWMLMYFTRPSPLDVERMIGGELAKKGIRLVSFHEANGPKGQTRYAPSFWTRNFCSFTWYEGEMEFTKDCYWRTDATEQLTVIPAGLEQATRALSQDKLTRKVAGAKAQLAVAALDNVLSTMTRGNKGQRLRIWGTVCVFALNLSDDDDSYQPSTRDPFITIHVVGGK